MRPGHGEAPDGETSSIVDGDVECLSKDHQCHGALVPRHRLHRSHCGNAEPVTKRITSAARSAALVPPSAPARAVVAVFAAAVVTLLAGAVVTLLAGAVVALLASAVVTASAAAGAVVT